MTQPADKPPEKPTQKLPAEEIQTGLLNKLVGAVTDLRGDVQAMRDETASEIKELRADIGLVASAAKNTADELRVTKESIELRFEKLETRQDSSSMRVKDVSKADMEQAAQLAQERAAREELAKKVDALIPLNQQQLTLLQDIKDGASKLLQRPEVKWLAAALWMAFTGWLATKGIK